jgi:hypothetical protein
MRIRAPLPRSTWKKRNTGLEKQNRKRTMQGQHGNFKQKRVSKRLYSKVQVIWHLRQKKRSKGF